MANALPGGPGQTDGQAIRLVGNQVGGKGPDGNYHIFSTDQFGALNVNTSGGGGGSNVNLVMVGGMAFALGQTTMALSLPVTIASDQTAIPVSGTVTANQGTPNTAANSWPVEITNGTVVLGTPTNPLRTDPTGTTVQPVSGTVAISGTVPVSGTVTANQGTSPWVASLASTTITGSVAVTGTFFQATQPVSGTVTANQGTSPWVVSGTITTTPPANASTNITQWASVVLGAPANYGTSPGAVIAGSVNAFVTNTVATTLASTTITGTVAVTQSTSPWVDNLTQVAGVILGATAVTAFGTAPAAANVPGVNSSLFSGTTALTNTAGALNVSMASTTVTGTVTVAGNKTNNSVVPGATNLGVLPGIANAATQTWTEGDQVLESMDLSGRQRIRGTLQNNNAAATADALSVLPAVATAAAPTYSANAMVTESVDLAGNMRVGIQNLTTPPSLATGNTAQLQCDYEGSLFTKPIRRSQTTAQATTIAASTTPTTVLAAQAAGIFADISTLVITPTPGATSNTAFKCTLSDGTNSFIYDLFTGSVATVTDDPVGINIAFNPPLPATTAATAWTVTNSSATPTVHITVVAVLQKAS